MIQIRQKQDVWIAGMLGVVFCLLCVSDEHGHRARAEPRRTKQGRVDTATLLEIEKRVLPPHIVPGPWSQETLPDFYWAANPQLKSRFDQAQTRYGQVTRTRPYRALTLVAGVAGLGKTFIKRKVFGDDCPSGDICKFDIKELYADWRTEGKTADKPDLFCGKVVISSLMSVTRPQDNLLFNHLVKQDAKFYVIDSLDEVHPDDYVWALKQIEDFVFRKGRDFVHVVVFGRPPAFCDYWHQCLARSNNFDASLFLLNPPEFRTTGDLQVSSWNYHCWRYKLAWSPAGNREFVPMPLHAYAEWTRLDFDRSGFFQTVSHESTNNITPDVHAELTQWARRQPIVGSMLQNLAGNSILREIVGEHVVAGNHYDEREVMKDYLSAWLLRETKADNRPSQAKPEYLDLYMRLLEGVAVKYLQEGKVDEQGHFAVAEDDVITVTYYDRKCSFPVRRILNRSGLIFVDPRAKDFSKYRFEPFWLHRLLVEKHNERQERAIALQASKSVDLIPPPGLVPVEKGFDK